MVSRTNDTKQKPLAFRRPLRGCIDDHSPEANCADSIAPAIANTSQRNAFAPRLPAGDGRDRATGGIGKKDNTRRFDIDQNGGSAGDLS
jgi:hypothetical protein